MYEEAISEHANLVNNQSEFSDDNTVSPEDRKETSPVVSVNETESSSSDSDMDEAIESSSSSCEESEQSDDDNSAPDDDNGAKWKMGRRIRLKFSRKRRNSYENPFVETERLMHLDTPVEDQKQMEYDSSAIHTESNTVSCDTENKPLKINKGTFRHFLAQKVLLRRQYSFSRKTQCLEDSSKNMNDSSRVTRSMVVKPKSVGEQWRNLCLKSIKLTKQCSAVNPASPKTKKKRWFSVGLLKLKNARQGKKSPTKTCLKTKPDILINNNSVSELSQLSDLSRMAAVTPEAKGLEET